MGKSLDMKLTSFMMNYIQITPKLKNLFNHHKQKIQVNKLFIALLDKLSTGNSYDKYEFNEHKIKGVTLRYFNNKLVKINFFERFFKEYIQKYIGIMDNEISRFYVDSTLIQNKLGIDKVTYNTQLKKHKSCKISIVCDEFGIPIIYKITSSNDHDSPIFYNLIDKISILYPSLCNNNNKFIGDSAYDSNFIREKLKKHNLGLLICERNIRNTKNKELIEKNKLTLLEKMLLKSRAKIEHLNKKLKDNKNIAIRYDKYMITYKNYVILALIKIAYSIIGNL